MHCPVALSSQLDVVAHCIEYGREDSSRGARFPSETVEHELRDWGVPYEVGSSQNLQMSRNSRLGQVENGLEIRHEQRSG
jgi:hypothetical protein